MFKKIGNILLDIVITIWFVVAIFVTVCLLSYNEFKVTTFGKSSLLIIDSDEMEPEFMEGDLLIVKRNADNKINVGDKVFYYNSFMDSSVLIYMDTVQGKQPVTKGEMTYLLDGERVSGEYIIGKSESAKAFHKWGSILGILTSKWGFMFLIIFPTLFAIMYEIAMIIELSRAKEEHEEEDDDDNDSEEKDFENVKKVKREKVYDDEDLEKTKVLKLFDDSENADDSEGFELTDLEPEETEEDNEKEDMDS